MALEGRPITLNKHNLPVNKASAIPGVSGKHREEILTGLSKAVSFHLEHFLSFMFKKKESK